MGRGIHDQRSAARSRLGPILEHHGPASSNNRFWENISAKWRARFFHRGFIQLARPDSQDQATADWAGARTLSPPTSATNERFDGKGRNGASSNSPRRE